MTDINRSDNFETITCKILRQHLLTLTLRAGIDAVLIHGFFRVHVMRWITVALRV